MIAAAMGTGKTAITIYVAIEHGFRMILILSPLRVVQVWKPQFETHSGVPILVVALDDSFAHVRAKREEAERQIKLPAPGRSRSPLSSTTTRHGARPSPNGR